MGSAKLICEFFYLKKPVACEIGVNAATVLCTFEQIMKQRTDPDIYEDESGKLWINKTLQQWKDNMFDYLSVGGLRRQFAKLKSLYLIDIAQLRDNNAYSLSPIAHTWLDNEEFIDFETYNTALAEYIKQQPLSPKSKLTEIPERPKPGYVYLIKAPNDRYKIGITKRPEQRLATFQTMMPFEVFYIHLIPTNHRNRLENELHQQFAGKRYKGEWFNLSPDDVTRIKSIQLMNYEDLEENNV